MKYYLFIFLSLLAFGPGYGQGISGTVVDAGSGAPLEGVVVYNSEEQVQTDIHGTFSLIHTPAGNPIQLWCTGYKPYTFVAGAPLHKETIRLQRDFQTLDEIVIEGKQENPRTIISRSVELISENYLPTNIALKESLTLYIYRPAIDTDIALRTQLYWYRAKNRYLQNYAAYLTKQDNLFSQWHTDQIRPEDYIYNYNDYPYADFAGEMKAAYRKQNTEDLLCKNLPDIPDATDNRVYHHILLLQKQETVQGDIRINVLSDFLIDKQTGAFKSIRYIYFPNNYAEIQEMLPLLTDASANKEYAKQLLQKENVKMLFFELRFDLDKTTQKWYPADYLLKNNFLFHPYMTGTGKERTIWMHYQTLGIVPRPPDNAREYAVPLALLRSGHFPEQ